MHARLRPAVTDSSSSLFEVGRNCCAVAHADRVALLVDGEAYFTAFMHAAERAAHSIIILAWDFNSGTRLHFDGARRGGPPEYLGDFLNWLARRRHGLHIHVLDWDYPMVFGVDREFPPIYGLGWKLHRRVHVAYDNTHPVGGSHHQKIVAIDDAMAFVGGFDLTARRWDTCGHCAEEARRTDGYHVYPPFHDMMMAVDGDAARVLARIARTRWHAATGRVLDPAPKTLRGDPWPGALEPDLTDVQVGIARTLPATAEHGEVHEVEQLYLDMIAAARRRIYIENQYFTAFGVGEALAERLAEPDGPEIVVVSRLFSHGWLEEHTMHVLRTRLLQRLREADRNGRFHAYYAHIDGLEEGMCIDVHSKLLIVDDDILRIGSANLCNRSMGMDSECDVAVEALGERRVSAAIGGFRDSLLGEHLDVPPQRVGEEVKRHGTLHGAIEALKGRARTLRPLDGGTEWPDAIIELARVGDPERPVSLDQLVDELRPVTPAPAAEGKFGRQLIGLIVIMLGLAAMWRFTPLAAWISADRITGLAQAFANRWWAPLVIMAAYTPASIVMFPRPLITLGAVVAFGPILGFTYAMSGILLASWLSYIAGRMLPRDTVRGLAGAQLNAVTETLRRRGLLAVTALRLVPLAPFAVEGLVAGAIHIKQWHFNLGTFLGMLPGTLAATVFGNQLETALRDPSEINLTLLVTIVVGMVALTLVVRRWLMQEHPEKDREAHAGH